MPQGLSYQNVSVDFASGLNQKKDATQVGLTPQGDQTLSVELTQCENRVFNKAKQLAKNLGYDRLTTSILGGGSISSARSVSVVGSQLVLITNTNLYVYDDQSDLWVNKGTVNHAQLTKRTIIQNDASQENQHSARLTDITVYTYLDSRGGLRYSVTSNDEKQSLVADTLIDVSARNACCFKLTSTLCGIFYVVDSTLYIRTVSNSTPTTLSSATSLFTTVNRSYPAFDFAEGTTFHAIAFYNTSGTVTVGKISTAGAVSSSGSLAITGTALFSIGALIDPATDNIFIAYQTGSGACGSFIFNSSLGTVVGNTSLAMTGNMGGGIAGYVSASNTVTWYGNTFLGVPAPYRIQSSSINTSGTVVGPTYPLADFSRIYSKIFTYNSEPYYWAMRNLSDEPTYYVVRATDSYVVTKALDSAAGKVWNSEGIILTSGIFPLPKAQSSSSKDFFVAVEEAAFQLIDRDPETLGLGGEARRSAQIGVTELSLDMLPTRSAPPVVDNGSLLIPGGHVQMFDGESVVENQFFHKPSFGQLQETANGGFSVTKIQDGSGGQPEIWELQCAAAYYVASTPAVTVDQYITFRSASDATTYYIRVQRNTAGTDPAPGGTGKTLLLLDSYTAEDVADAFYNLFATDTNFATDFVVTKPSANKIRITNAANGNSTDATIGTLGVGRMPDATYTYVACFEWTDRLGRTHQSEPSEPVAFEVTNGPAIGVLVPVRYCQLTNKKSSLRNDVSVVLYRSVSGLYRRASVFTQPFFSSTTPSSTFTVNLRDVSTDAELNSFPPLYSEGGILENVSPGSVAFVKKIKDRIWAYNTETKTVWFSKFIQGNIPTAFNDTLTLEIEPSELPVNEIGELDEKIVFFTDNQPYYVVGDGPNDIGQGSFSSVENIIAPVGCRDIGSAVRTPLGLLYWSKKGAYMMGRALDSAFIGAGIEDYKDYKCVGAELLPNKAQARLLLENSSGSSVFALYDYDFNQWATRVTQGTAPTTIPVGSTVWNDRYVYANNDGTVWAESLTLYQDNAVAVNSVIETGWIKMAGIQGFQRIQRILILGEALSAHNLLVDVGYDFSSSYSQTFTFALTAGRFQKELHLARQKCDALRLRIRESDSGSGIANTNTITNITLKVAVKKGVNKRPAAEGA